MPFYDYRCECGKEFTRFLPMAEYQEPQFHGCNSEVRAIKLLSAPAVIGDYAPYNCPITGKLISGRKAHDENLARHGCRVYEPGETQAYRDKLKQEDTSFDKAIDAEVDHFVATAPEAKRVQLFNEVAAGMDVSVVRK